MRDLPHGGHSLQPHPMFSTVPCSETSPCCTCPESHGCRRVPEQRLTTDLLATPPSLDKPRPGSRLSHALTLAQAQENAGSFGQHQRSWSIASSGREHSRGPSLLDVPLPKLPSFETMPSKGAGEPTAPSLPSFEAQLARLPSIHIKERAVCKPQLGRSQSQRGCPQSLLGRNQSLQKTYSMHARVPSGPWYDVSLSP